MLPLTPLTLEFSCGHCGATLSVPVSMAGVRGPCPRCRQTIEAPRAAPHPRKPLDVGRRSPEPPVPSSRRDEKVERDETEESPPEGADAEDQPAGVPARRAAVFVAGAMLGGLAVFGGMWAWDLRRDLSPKATPPESLAVLSRAAESNDDAVAALAELRLESSRETKALLAAQQIIWRFFSAASRKEAAACLDEVPVGWTQAILAGEPPAFVDQVTLRTKRRLPDGAGYDSQWAVVTRRHGEIIIKVSDRSGAPRLAWSSLEPQLRSSAAPLAGPAGQAIPDQR